MKKVFSLADQRDKIGEDALRQATSIEEVARWQDEKEQASIRALNMILEGNIDDNSESTLQNTTERGSDIMDFFRNVKKISSCPIPINREQEKMLMIVRNGKIEQMYRFRYTTYLINENGEKIIVYYNRNQEGTITEYHATIY